MAAQILNQNSRPLNPTTREMVTIGPGGIYVSIRLTDSLVAYGLGACIAVCLYDYKRKIAGMAYVTLPCSRHFKDAEVSTVSQPARFVDQGIAVLLDAMTKYGGSFSNIKAILVGGSHVNKATKSAGQIPEIMRTGTRIVEEATEILLSAGIEVVGKDIAGASGRTAVFRVCDGCIIVKPTGLEARVMAMLNSVGSRIAA